jgi:uncharacterized protein (DUF1684 family)
MAFRAGATLRRVVLLLAGLLMTVSSKPQAKSQAEVDAWRAEQDAEMRAPDSPLGRRMPIALRPGANRLGSAADDGLRFESAGVPAHALELTQEGNRVHLTALLPLVSLNGQLPSASVVLKPGDRIEVGPLRLRYEGGNLLSVQDAAKPEVLEYRGLHYLPIDWRYRVDAVFEPAESNKTLRLETTTGGERDLPFKGVLKFQLLGKPYTLEAFALGERPDDYFVIFRDGSNGKKSYGAGRFLWVKGAQGGKTVVDFNQAWNPLCAYSDGFNCPLAPPENRLPIEIPVGEAAYHQ